jgi:hypothetical protein
MCAAHSDLTAVDGITDSLARAFDRIVDFQAVQRGASRGELIAAVGLLLESVGITDDERAVAGEKLELIRGSDRAPGHVLLGLMSA